MNDSRSKQNFALPRKHRQSAGKSLVELIVVMSILSFILMQVSTMMVVLLRLNGQIATQQSELLAESQFIERFQNDVRGAVALSVEKDCQLQLADGRRVAYFEQETQMVREVSVDGKVVHRDGFSLGLLRPPVFERQQQGVGVLLKLSYSVGRGSSSKESFEVDQELIVAAGYYAGLTTLPSVSQEVMP